MRILSSLIIGSNLIFYTLSCQGAQLSMDVSENGGRQELYILEEVRITAVPLYDTLDRASQEVKVLNKEELKNFGFDIYSGIDIRERGGFGVQEDLSLRGTTFEQNLVLFEGVRVSDLQTGHHLMNLPFTTENLANLEIIPGGLSPFYGPGGFGGALNFLLEPPTKGLTLKAGIGSYDLYEGTLMVGLPLGSRNFNLSLEQRKANGFIWNRDFDIISFNLYTKDANSTFFYGYVEKDFGGRYFYTPRFKTEWEETRTHLVLAKRVIPLGNSIFEPAFLYRKNYDHYLLDRNNPHRYQNKHQSYLYRINLPLKFESGFAVITTGLEGSYESLRSSRLGEYLRRNMALYVGVKPNFGERVHPSVQIRYDYHPEEKDFLSLGAGLAYLYSNEVKLRGAVNYSYRLPSVTELRYQAIGIRGNPELSAERALNVEVGMDLRTRSQEWSLTLFYRKGQDLIDWVFNGTHTVAQNLHLKTLGFTVDGKYRWGKNVLFLSYTVINHSGHSLSWARYHGNYLRHNFIVGGEIKLPYSFKGVGSINYQKRYKQGDVYVVNISLDKKLGKNLKFIVWAKNLLDEKYYEIRYNEADKGVLGLPQWFGLRFEASL
ncbi:MAG: TonB-dependent receptor [Caldimicrobium sp.]|nr:TonB-dependent receptor [Caldimicrobium sp.]MCX7613301.1 TonB-dependent receptor [Caldimicrobium sp.]MDW8183418.1 TonB-dependent receptor [Caldimicrobium sp.]